MNNKNLMGEITAQTTQDAQSKKFFGTINTTGTMKSVECQIVDAFTIIAGDHTFQGPIVDCDPSVGTVKMTDFATGEELVFLPLQAGLFGVDYYEAATDTRNHPIQDTMWRISEDIAREDFNNIRDMLVRVHNNLPGSFLEYDTIGNITNIWLWSDEKRGLLLRQVVVNFPVQVPAEAVKF